MRASVGSVAQASIFGPACETGSGARAGHSDHDSVLSVLAHGSREKPAPQAG